MQLLDDDDDNDLFGPFIFAFVIFKERPTTTNSVSFDLGSCPDC